jgi:hypothetical protein
MVGCMFLPPLSINLATLQVRMRLEEHFGVGLSNYINWVNEQVVYLLLFFCMSEHFFFCFFNPSTITDDCDHGSNGSRLAYL